MSSQHDHVEEIRYSSWIGKKVRKKKRPFASGLKENTVKDVVRHWIRGCWAFTFEEDGSMVECRRCTLTQGENDDCNLQ